MKMIVVLASLLFAGFAHAEETRFTPADCAVTDAQIASAMKSSLVNFFDMEEIQIDASSVTVASVAAPAALPAFALYKSVSFKTTHGDQLAFMTTNLDNQTGVKKTAPGLMFKRGVRETFDRLGRLQKRECVLGIADDMNIPYYDWKFSFYNVSTGVALEELTADYTMITGEDLSAVVAVPMR